MRPRSWGSLVAGIGLALGAGLMAGGVVLVALNRIDAVTASMVGGLALIVAEAGVAGSERLVVRPAVAGTWVERALVVGASVVTGLGVALLIGTGGRPSAASVLVGIAGVMAFIGLVGVQATRAGGAPRDDARDAAVDHPT